jgi:hypothetical protein
MMYCTTFELGRRVIVIGAIERYEKCICTVLGHIDLTLSEILRKLRTRLVVQPVEIL